MVAPPSRLSYHGRRTSSLIEGTIEVVPGLFFADSIVGLFAALPSAIVGAMMFMVGLELVKFARHVRAASDIAVIATTDGRRWHWGRVTPR